MAFGEGNLGEAVLHLGTDNRGLRQGLAQAQRTTTARVKKISKIAAGIGIGAATGIGLVSLKAAMGLEKSFAEVRTLLPEIGDEAFGALQKDVLALSKEMGIATNQAVPALYQAISAGVPEENVASFMSVASKAAIGGVTDLETAVDGITLGRQCLRRRDHQRAGSRRPDVHDGQAR